MINGMIPSRTVARNQMASSTSIPPESQKQHSPRRPSPPCNGRRDPNMRLHIEQRAQDALDDAHSELVDAIEQGLATSSSLRAALEWIAESRLLRFGARKPTDTIRLLPWWLGQLVAYLGLPLQVALAVLLRTTTTAVSRKTSSANSCIIPHRVSRPRRGGLLGSGGEVSGGRTTCERLADRAPGSVSRSRIITRARGAKSSLLTCPASSVPSGCSVVHLSRIGTAGSPGTVRPTDGSPIRIGVHRCASVAPPSPPPFPPS